MKTLLRCLIYLMYLMFSIAAFAENIDPDNDGSQYAWGENAGWINFEPAFGPGITITNTAVTGYAWGENIGWINFAHIGGNVSINPDTGVFSGYAWGENIGWINFVPNGKPVKTAWRGVVNRYLGDMNSDGVIDISDVILVLRCALGLPIEPYECLPCGNIDQISGVDISDVILTLRMALGLDDWRPC